MHDMPYCYVLVFRRLGKCFICPRGCRDCTWNANTWATLRFCPPYENSNDFIRHLMLDATLVMLMIVKILGRVENRLANR